MLVCQDGVKGCTRTLGRIAMKRQNITLSNGWRVRVFYSVTSYHLYEIMDSLRNAGCDKESMAKAFRNISSGKLDTGLTYSNPRTKESVMVIGYASSADEYANSIFHETQHLVKHITKTLGIDPYGEEICYLAGEVGAAINHFAHDLLCDNCLSKLRG